MKRVVRLRALVAAPLLAIVCLTISAAGAGAAAPTGTRVVAPRPLIPRGATKLGPVSPTTTVTGTVVLQPRNESALTRFISQVSDKHSVLFRHYLTPGAFAARFGPAPASIAAVEEQLRASGLTVTSVAPDGLLMDFRAPAGRVETAFRTGLARYKLADGSIGQARTAPLKVPSAIARYVTSVVGLDTTVKLRPSGILRTPASARTTHVAALAPSFTHPAGSPTACADATATAQAFGGLTDDQIANAYGVFGLYGATPSDTGVGQSIAIFELEPFTVSDLKTFDTCYFGATQATTMVSHVHTINVDGGPQNGSGSGESILDIEDVSAFAPGANIDVYQAPNTSFASLDEYAKIVNDDQDQIVSTSWGICEQAIQAGSPGVQQAENLIFEQAAAQGQTVFSAAGDEGSNDCNAFRTTAPTSPVLSVDDPSSQPYVVSAGGTTMDNATQPASEHVWNDGAVYGAAGGGISEAWPMPSWQRASQVPGVNNPAAVAAATTFEANDLGDPGYAFCRSENPGAPGSCREVPDVSAVADEFTSGITIYIAAFGGWSTIGGTSSAAPMWAGMLADVNESATCKSNNLQDGVGFVNPLLYAVASNPTAYAASFNDITTGNNDPYGKSTLFQATTGYDMASGLGTPQLTRPGGGSGLAFYLCNQGPAVPRPTVTSVSPAVGFTSDPSTPVTITGTNFAGVANVQVGEFALAAGDGIAPGTFKVTDAQHIAASFPPAADVVPPNDQTDGAGQVQVSVTLQNGKTSAIDPVHTAFLYVDRTGSSQLPTVTGVHSFTGPETGGNTVIVYGAGFGTTATTSVTFGGVPGTNVKVNASATQITVTVPAFSNSTVCDQDGSTFDASQNAANDICQTQVVVTTPEGSSTTSTILPLYEGAIAFADDGVLPAPAGDEAAPAATEYDYVPAPHITSISTSGGPTSLASEQGDSVITLTGSGFNLASLDWVNFGDPTQADSQQFFNLVEVTGTKIEITAPGFSTETVNTLNVPVSVQSAAGLSNQTNATYAGAPAISSVRATAGPTSQTNAGPDYGGTPIDVKGVGLANQVTSLVFDDVSPNQFSLGTQYNFTAHSNTDLTSTTVAQNPAVVDTQACTVTDCSAPTSVNNDPADVFILYPPGDPKIDSISPSSGSALGGTKVTITGENLGCVTNIAFGNAVAQDFTNAEALLDCGSTDTVTVTAPAGTVGTVPVTLETVESEATGAPPAQGSFTYTKPPTETVRVHRSGNGSGKVTSTPAGISCGKTCSHKFAFGTAVTLKAKASRGSSFAGWTGGCTGKSTCKFTADAALSITAKFTLRSCVVPKVIGKTLPAAKRTLKAHFCAAGRVTLAASSKKKGLVISQKPKPGTHLRHGGKVGLTVSKGT